MKLRRQELWPALSLNEDYSYECYGLEADIPQDRIDWVNETWKEFKKVQTYLEDVFDYYGEGD